MLHFIAQANWNQLYYLLAAGEPPMVFRILVLNTLFFILFAVRRSRGAHAMRREVAIRVQGLLIAANVLILFQEEIINFMNRYI